MNLQQSNAINSQSTRSFVSNRIGIILVNLPRPEYQFWKEMCWWVAHRNYVEGSWWHRLLLALQWAIHRSGRWMPQPTGKRRRQQRGRCERSWCTTCWRLNIRRAAGLSSVADSIRLVIRNVNPGYERMVRASCICRQLLPCWSKRWSAADNAAAVGL